MRHGQGAAATEIRPGMLRSKATTHHSRRDLAFRDHLIHVRAHAKRKIRSNLSGKGSNLLCCILRPSTPLVGFTHLRSFSDSDETSERVRVEQKAE
eukprot:6179223-Pleurochrysis_carterae.AAC.7